MTELPRSMLLALWVMLLFICRETIGDSRRTRGSRDELPSPASATPEVGSKRNRAASPNWSRQLDISINSFSKGNNTNPGNDINENVTRTNLQEDIGQMNGMSSANTDKGNTRTTTVISGRPSRPQGRTGWSIDTGAAPVCAYRMMEGGIEGQLCFRHTQFEFKCQHDCRTVRSQEGSLMANVMTNGSVLLQWTRDSSTAEVHGETKENLVRRDKKKKADTETTPPKAESQRGASGEPRKTLIARQKMLWNVQPAQKSGFELSCSWNGSYTQFECTGVHLGSGCRDFLLIELHENVPYRICLHPLPSTALSPGPTQRRSQRGCVEFTITPSGMQDIVIAMTTVGGAICVMLVIICLLVAYITENIMSPTTQNTHSTYQTHSRH